MSILEKLEDATTFEFKQFRASQEFGKVAELYTFGNYGDYVAFKDELPPLSEKALDKLYKISILRVLKKFFSQGQYEVSFKTLQESVPPRVDVEQKLIELMRAKAVSGKLDNFARLVYLDNVTFGEATVADRDSLQLYKDAEYFTKTDSVHKTFIRDSAYLKQQLETFDKVNIANALSSLEIKSSQVLTQQIPQIHQTHETH